MIFRLKFTAVFSVLILSCLPTFAQTDGEKQKPNNEPFLGFTDNRDVYFQTYLGLGYSFYRMRNEADRVEFLQDEGFDVTDLSGSFSFNAGLAAIFKTPGIRLLLDYRGDNYGNTGTPSISLDFGNTKTGYELEHNLYNMSIGLEKLIFTSDQNEDYFGLGGSYVFIRDIRSEKILFKSNGSDKTAKTSTDILAKAFEIHVSVGGIRKGKVFGEARFGYQFQQSFTIQSNKTKPGLSTDGYVPDFNSFAFKIVVGILL